jgi:hypothetical protein
VFSPRPDGVMLGVIACLVGIAATTVLPSGIVRPLMGEEPVAATGSSESLGGYLSTWKIDRDGRRLLEEPGAWDEARQALALRVLTRLVLAPPKLAVRWNEDAVPVAGPGQPAEDAGRLIGNAMIRATGRAVFVAPQVLPPAQAEIFGRPQIDMVRIVTPAGFVLDVLTDAAPRSWPRWKAIDESAAVVGLRTGSNGRPSRRGSSWRRRGSRGFLRHRWAASDSTMASSTLSWTASGSSPATPRRSTACSPRWAAAPRRASRPRPALPGTSCR